MFSVIKFVLGDFGIISFVEMFGASVDNTWHDSSGGSGDELIPARFVWRYGGRRVFLSGSFTG